MTLWCSSYLILIINVLFYFSELEKKRTNYISKLIYILNKKNFLNIFLSFFVLASCFYIIFYKRLNFEYENRQSYHYYEFVENNKKFFENKELRILDTSDGAFAFYSNIGTFHAKGLAGTAEYLKYLESIKLKGHIHDVQNINVLKSYLKYEKIKYVLYYSSYNENFFNNKCKKSFYEIYNVFNSVNNKKALIGLIRANDYEKFINFCIT